MSKVDTMSEYWLISAPGDKTCQDTWKTLNNRTKENNLSENYIFNIPDLKVGTLDQLVDLSDELNTLDNIVHQIAHRLAECLSDVMACHKDDLREHLSVNEAELSDYITNFTWDIAKYSIKQPLRKIADIIRKQVTQIDLTLKSKSTNYNNLKNNLLNKEKKESGSLLTRNLTDLVKKEYFVLNSKYLTTILVLVPINLFKEWYSKFETLTDYVVPRSSELIYNDNEYGLFTITLFNKVVQEFKHVAHLNEFIVRDFTYNEEEVVAGRTEITKLFTDKQKHLGQFIRWLKVNFSECFSAWIHIKALRVFVESVLRYGLPVNFQAMLIHPNSRTVKKLREMLNRLYSHLDVGSRQQNVQYYAYKDNFDISGLEFGVTDYYPYVYFKINIDPLDAQHP